MFFRNALQSPSQLSAKDEKLSSFKKQHPPSLITPIPNYFTPFFTLQQGLEQAVCPCPLQVPPCPLLYWPSLLFTFGLRAAVVSPLASQGGCSPVAAPPGRPGMLLASLPGAKTACLHALHGSGQPGDFLSSEHGSAVPGQALWEVGYEIRSIFFFRTDFFLFSERAVGIWVKWSVEFNFCILNFKQGLITPRK